MRLISLSTAMLFVLLNQCSGAKTHPTPLGDPFSDPDFDFHLASYWRHDPSHDMTYQSSMIDQEGEGGSIWYWLRGKTGGFAGWINPWQEGSLEIMIEPERNITLLHRLSAFPADLDPDAAYPITGILRNITSFPELDASSAASSPHPIYGCDPLDGSVDFAAQKKHRDRDGEKQIALLLRGKCSFSHKVRVAQARGADAVLVADDVRREGEMDEEGRERDGLLTMYSPDDTSDIYIPSSFISRASYLVIRDLHRDLEAQGRAHGLEIVIKPDEGPLSDILLFVMLIPTMVMVMSIFVGRYRAARRREAERAPPTVVLSLPETVWTPEEWEKDDTPPPSVIEASAPNNTDEILPMTRPVSIPASPLLFSQSNVLQPLASSSASPHAAQVVGPTHGKKERKKYFHGDECSICLNSFERGDHVRILPCGHLFHKMEIDSWLLEWKKLCPVCRMDVTRPLTEAALSASASSINTPLGSADLPIIHTNERQGRYARLRGYLPFGRLLPWGLEEGVIIGERTVAGRELVGSRSRGNEPNERTSLLGDT